MNKNPSKSTSSEVAEKLKKQPNAYFVPDFGEIEAADSIELRKKVNKLRKDKDNGNN